MGNSRIPGGRAIAILGAIAAVLAVSGPVRGADPIPLIPPVATPPSAASAPPVGPAHKVAATVKHMPAPTHSQTRPLIPPAALPNQSSQLAPPPAPREPLPIETELLPLGSPPAASTPPKSPAS